LSRRVCDVNISSESRQGPLASITAKPYIETMGKSGARARAPLIKPDIEVVP
jgi:hypothetical protein